MNGIPHFDYSPAPFWPSYQNKIIGVLNRALREQSVPGTADPASSAVGT